MKVLKATCVRFVLLSMGVTACQSVRSQVERDQEGQAQYFATAEEAIGKARADFLSVLRSESGLNNGLKKPAILRMAIKK